MSAVSEKSCQIETEEERPLHEVAKGYTPFQNDDVLIAKITPCFENGKIAIAKIKHSIGFGSTEFHVIRSTPLKLDSRYIYHFLRQEKIRNIGKERMTGSAGQQRVPVTFFNNLQIPLPPLEEQRRISAVLDKADELRTKRRAALARLDTLMQSIFLNMFGDPVTNPMGWKTKPLGELANVGTGSTPSREQSENYGGGIPWVKTTEVNWESINFTEETVSTAGIKRARLKIYPKNSVIIAMYGQGITRGKSAILGIDACVNQACAVIQPSASYFPEYLSTLLQIEYERIRGLGRGGNQPNLNLNLVRSLIILVPPVEHQRKFAEISHKILRQKEQFLISAKLGTDLFHSLQQRAFNGRL